MEVKYRNTSIEKVCTKASVSDRKYGYEMTEKIQQRIDEIKAATSVEQMIQFRVGRCHPLHHNREGQYAVDLVQPKRLVFTKEGNEIQIATIIEITDYH